MAGRRRHFQQQQQQSSQHEDDDRASIRSTGSVRSRASTSAATVGTTTSLASRVAVLNTEFAEKLELASVYEGSLQAAESYDSGDEQGPDEQGPHVVEAGPAQSHGAESEAPLHRARAFQVCSRIFNFKASGPVLLKRLTIQQCEELKVYGYTVVDGLISKDLASHIKANALSLLRKGRMEEGVRAAVSAGVQPDTCAHERVVRGDHALWLTVGRPPADSWPLSALLVALHEVYEDLAQFVKLRRCCGEYQVSVQPAGAVGMSRHRDAYPESGSLQAPAPQQPASGPVQGATATGGGTHSAAQLTRLASHGSTSTVASSAAAGYLGSFPLLPHSSTGAAPLHAAGGSTGAVTHTSSSHVDTQLSGVSEDTQAGEGTAAGAEGPAAQPVGSRPAATPASHPIIGLGQHASAATTATTAGPGAGGAQQVVGLSELLGDIAAVSAAASAPEPHTPHIQLPAQPQQQVALPANAQLQQQQPLQQQQQGPGASCTVGPRRMTCMVCCNPEWERDQGGVVRVWPPRRGGGGPGQSGQRARRSLTGSEAGLSQMSEDRSDTFSLRSHYLANFGAASVTSSMWAELGLHEAETASVDGSLLDAQDKEERLGLECQEVEGEVVVDVAPLAGRMLLFLSGAVEHAVSSAAADQVTVTAWY